MIVKAEVTYRCYMSEKDSQLIRDYAEENELSLKDAANEIFGELSIYDEFDEIESMTTDIEEVEED